MRKAGGMGKIKNIKMNETRASSSVSSQINGGSVLPSLQYLIRLLHGTMEGQHARKGLYLGSFLSF